MNILGLSVKLVHENSSIELSHIPFENSAFIWPTDKSDLKMFVGDDGLIVPSELEKSTYSSGNYLIFTDVSGIADDGGWDYVQVIHEDKLVHWRFCFNRGLIELVFDLPKYKKEIVDIMNQLELLPKNIIIEPSQVIFPE